ncbi:MAG TPA: ribosome biogenesis factor YjgA [Steroidobacteraceae bacterium]|nr:ribosome biogenesis factor YjgA [Steroidobacteraceae bacterium]
MARKQAFFDERPPDDPEGLDDEGPSKSELKRQDLQLRELGVALVDLPAAELEALDLPEKLLDAVTACRGIRAHGARLRQEMYIAKVLRHVDVEPIRAFIERRSDIDRQRVRREQGLEQWRERLLADEAAAWTELAALIDDPAALQRLRTLARQARAEKAASRPPAAARQLFRRLRELLESRGI